MSRLMVDSPKARGLATSTGTSESGLRTAALAEGAGRHRNPPAAVREELDSGGPHAREQLPSVQAGPATYSRPSTVT